VDSAIDVENGRVKSSRLAASLGRQSIVNATSELPCGGTSSVDGSTRAQVHDGVMFAIRTVESVELQIVTVHRKLFWAQISPISRFRTVIGASNSDASRHSDTSAPLATTPMTIAINNARRGCRGTINADGFIDSDFRINANLLLIIPRIALGSESRLGMKTRLRPTHRLIAARPPVPLFSPKECSYGGHLQDDFRQQVVIRVSGKNFGAGSVN
jgi:hypothetical protein